MPTTERAMDPWIAGAAAVAQRPLRIGRHLLADGIWQTILISNNHADGLSYYALLPDPCPEDEAAPTFPIQRRCDLENAIRTLEYVAGGGEL